MVRLGRGAEMGEAYDSLPDWLRNKISQEYEIEAMAWMLGKDIRQGKATYAEMCASLCLATELAPLTYDATQIYLFVATSLMEERGMIVPADVRVTELTQDQERMLKDWQYQLYRKRGKAETQITKALKEVFRNRKKTAGTEAAQKDEVSDMHMQQATPPNAGTAGFVEGTS